jgi:hypothetical protein
MSERDPAQTAELVSLLAVMFTTEEFLAWSRNMPWGRQLQLEVNTRAAGSYVFRDAVDWWVRRGSVDADLFESLVDIRPLQEARIRDVSAAWLEDRDHERLTRLQLRLQRSDLPTMRRELLAFVEEAERQLDSAPPGTTAYAKLAITLDHPPAA